MNDSAVITLYLARRDAYAAFLNAVDEERTVIWHREAGRYETDAAAIAAIDRVYDVTRARFNVIDLEGVGPVKEGRALVERLADMEKGDPKQPAWADFKKAREDFVSAASRYLQGLIPEARS
ncbi:putative hypothetical protein [Streptomyces sp. NBRC 110611]|uniref:hypothetical protein n=1 Tax=Streptomyces sp. NBRC 110611 TaxID=1621259 RepID=UPI0008583340|nr:hypothetical protein [Streptomyces sp. NBRC 110611]GAU67707.1 putative hypothetical protein [Streptomyces sp. NBRC 110611]